MSAIRPDLPALPPRTGATPTVRAAQADFFRTALAQVQAAQAQQDRTGSVQPTVAPMTVEPPRPADETRTPRPGSLLDIRV
ncbi:hypothetical protein BH09PSE1_BH09PSE1_16520 [soil metagenome]